MKKIGIIYFVYLNVNKNWKSIIKKQLTDVKKSGIFDDSCFYVVVSNPYKVPHDLIHDFFYSIIQSPNISIFDENKFEFWGIHRLWEVAKTGKHDYLIYFHTKGMSYRSGPIMSALGARSIREILLTYFCFSNYKKKIDIFQNIPSVSKIAFLNCRDEDGSRCFSWFNFFWIRSDFVSQQLEEPIENSDRYYYESWNGVTSKGDGRNGNTDSAFSLYYRDKKYCTSSQASDILSRLRKRYKYTFPFSRLLMNFLYK